MDNINASSFTPSHTTHPADPNPGCLISSEVSRFYRLVTDCRAYLDDSDLSQEDSSITSDSFEESLEYLPSQSSLLTSSCARMPSTSTLHMDAAQSGKEDYFQCLNQSAIMPTHDDCTGNTLDSLNTNSTFAQQTSSAPDMSPLPPKRKPALKYRLKKGLPKKTSVSKIGALVTTCLSSKGRM